ncbi:hypothetical protein Drose_04030 [Dactylosporangium roseum]|uniref:Uncharacterized protein n=1 Tax=Dactylosporangium roseum TaxID=47989 RepID=A0ABY5Z6H6_9ACTN|nr:hypothetical protein [Dactylosporangium roseum]UWZ37457.1 hypothetical protein Drose_04030 [Dactylosporangium roseum]
MISYLAAPVDAPSDSIMNASAVFMALLLALILDYSAAGSTSLRDKMILVFGTPAIYCGWNEGPLDIWIVQQISNGMDWLLAHSGALHFAGVSSVRVIGMISGCLFVYAVFALLPNKIKAVMGKRAAWLGKAVSWKLPETTGRINFKLWAVAAALGLFGDLARGAVGGPVVPAIKLAAQLVNWVLSWAFGTE